MDINEILKRLFLTKTSSDTEKIVPITNQCPEGLKKLIRKDFSEIRVKPIDPDQMSLYKERFTKINHLRTTNWASTSSSPAVYYLLNADITTHLSIIFENIASIYNADLQFMSIVLCRNNLFHGHVLYNKELNDILIVFHAFEYPEDLEPQKSSQAKKIESGIAEFKSFEVDAFVWRNAIYSVNKNCIYISDINQEPYCSQLRIGPPCYCTLDENKVGERLFDINYFPQENLPLFSA